MVGHSPVWLVQLGCRGLGGLVWHFSDRRRTILGGLRRAFPEKAKGWHEQIGREHASRMFEMFLLIVAMPHWSEARCRERVQVGASMQALLNSPTKDGPMVFLIPHAAMTEAIPMLKFLRPEMPEVITLYRPLDFGPAEAYVKSARERFGVKLVARKEGLLKAKKQLQSGRGVAGILFDQSAGSQGHMMLFFNRVCSTTNLPGLLAVKTGARPIFVHSRRDGFWRGTIEAEILPFSQHPAEVMTNAHRALEALIAADDNNCADWFWAHKRWKGPLRPATFLSFPERKSYLPEQLAELGLETIPRSTRIVVRLDGDPNSAGMARTVLGALRTCRPDAVFWLLVPSDLEAPAAVGADRVVVLSASKRARRETLRAISAEGVDAFASLDPEPMAVGESVLLECDLRFGVCVRKPPRKCYQRHVILPAGASVSDRLAAWRQLLLELGMKKESAVDLIPLNVESSRSSLDASSV
jgi:heptosyltransferase-2